MKGTRLTEDWRLPDDYAKWAKEQRPDLNPYEIAAEFRDYWISKPGKDGAKLNWKATWRNWIRRQRKPQGLPNKTIAHKMISEPTLTKDEWRREKEKAREKIREIRKILKT